jgi:hypothetical protein
VKPCIPCGPTIRPIFVHPLLSSLYCGGKFFTQTYKSLSIIYESPCCALVGNRFVNDNVPLILIVPGFIPPIVVPLGNANFSFITLIERPPIYIVFAEI